MARLIGLRTCRGCGCTDSRACEGGCSWVLLDIAEASGVCSSCAELLAWEPALLGSIDRMQGPSAAELASAGADLSEVFHSLGSLSPGG